MEAKYCPTRETEKPVAEFSKNKSRRDGLQNRCKACTKAYRTGDYNKRPEVVARSADYAKQPEVKAKKRERDSTEEAKAKRRARYVPVGRTPQERFESFVVPEPNSGCHLWAGGWFDTGYGVFTLDDTTIGAHRVSLFFATGVMPKPGNHVHHECEIKACVNPDHLVELTPEEHAEVHRDML